MIKKYNSVLSSLLFITISLGSLLHASSAEAQSKKELKSEFSTLGNDQEVIERIKNLDSHKKIRIVQNRLVDRNNRIELGMKYAYNGGGDSYVTSQNLGGQLEYHLNPRWSFGLEFDKSYNTLTPEGQNQFDLALAAQKIDPASTQRFPSVDYPIESQLFTISYYPIYGKLNLFDSGIAQFDVYTQLGYGNITLYSGKTNLTSLGLGVGLWLTQRITSRLEVRYQNYKDLLLTEERNQNNLQALASLGILIW
ncbi:MAG: outer membrane beta-barrel domain-containing protein [Bdellovibrionales bacterium]|nr:outer membrane beta-barrel domain-containing protein [Bdellovibrionales bacterium]